MECKNCGHSGISVDDRFCKACGANQSPDVDHSKENENQNSPADQAGFEVPVSVDNINFVDAFVTKNLPDSARPRLLVDQSAPLVVSKWMFGTKMLHFHVFLALHGVAADADLPTAFEALRTRVDNVDSVDISIVEVRAASGETVPNIRFKGKGLKSYLIPTLFAAGVMRSPLPDIHEGWVVHMASTKGWASYDALSAVAAELGYSIVFE